MSKKSGNQHSPFESAGEATLTSKVVYGIVAGIIIVCALVVGLVSSANRKKAQPEPQKPAQNQSQTQPEQKDDSPSEEPKKEEPITFRAPTVGSVIKYHSDSVPVWSVTLEEYRTHAGIDIATEEKASVCAAAAGVVSKVGRDPLLGMTVEITHNEELKTVYSNLDKDSLESLTVGQAVAAGEVIGCVGDSSISELCDEPHLHFEMLAMEKSVNPLDYLTEASKKEALGILPGEVA